MFPEMLSLSAWNSDICNDVRDFLFQPNKSCASNIHLCVHIRLRCVVAEKSMKLLSRHSRERKAKLVVLITGLYSTHFSLKIRQEIHWCSKVCFETRSKVSEFFPPMPLFPDTGNIKFDLYLRREVPM
ncbi:hypothetical protein AVEN_157773-1 [Araneus ventricosus]|uniref:Uncharacterized protein n=1 Tax=Araneus ventricosus TaxID=182803 RepID=A0A4Y2F4W7_ARAVE|nr:hypothetical protein AVEN_157773-1 [Araneus ventricosus]